VGEGEVREDLPDDRAIVQRGDQPEAASTMGTRQHVDAERPVHAQLAGRRRAGGRADLLSRSERQAWGDSREALARGLAELRRLQNLQEDVRWGRVTLSEGQQERLRQFLASRGEITAGDRFVLKTLRLRARERQRYWLGLPLTILGAGAAAWLAWSARHQASGREPARDTLGR
jgi:hypothetical protein